MTDLNTIEREFKKLETLAPDLNATSDEFTAVLETLNKRLNGLNLGVELLLPYDQMKIAVGYGKFQGKWGIIVRRDDAMIGTEIWHLTEAPRNLRLHAINRIEPLLAEMASSTKRLNDRIREGVSQLKDITEAIR
jgi:prefoldin subunit 5